MSHNILEILHRYESKISTTIILGLLGTLLILACSEPASATPTSTLPVNFIVAETPQLVLEPTEEDLLYALDHPKNTVLVNCIDAVEMLPLLSSPNPNLATPEVPPYLVTLSDDEMSQIDDPKYNSYVSSTGSYVLQDSLGHWTSGTLTRIPTANKSDLDTHLYIGPEHFINTTPDMFNSFKDHRPITMTINHINPLTHQIETVVETEVLDCKEIVATYPHGYIAAIATLIKTTQISVSNDLQPYEGLIGGPCDLSGNLSTFGFNDGTLPALQTLSGPYYWNLGGGEYRQGYSVGFIEAEVGVTIPGASGGIVSNTSTENFCGVDNFYTYQTNEQRDTDLNTGFTVLPDPATMQEYIRYMSQSDTH